MKFNVTISEAACYALPKCRDEGTPDLFVLALPGETHVERIDGTALSATEEGMVRFLLGCPAEKVS